MILLVAVVAAGFFLHRKPCRNPYSWSQTAPVEMTFEEAVKYCGNLEENGFDDWRLPSLFEIRTLENACLEEENSDFCTVTDSCEWDNCENEFCGKCLKYDESVGYGTFWTQTANSGGKVATFTINSEKIEENQSFKSDRHPVKCVREACSE